MPHSSWLLLALLASSVTQTVASAYGPRCKQDTCFKQAHSSRAECSKLFQTTVTKKPVTRGTTVTVSTTIMGSVTTTVTDTITATSTNDVTETQDTTVVETATAYSTVYTDTTITNTDTATTTVTATAATVTVNPNARRDLEVEKRNPAKKAVCPEACKNTVSFSSACACVGVKTSTVRVPASPATIFATRTVSTTYSATNVITERATLTATQDVTNTATEVDTATSTTTTTILTTDVNTDYVTTTTTTTTTVTITPSCSLSTSAPTTTQRIVNPNFDAQYTSSQQDDPWVLSSGGNSEFYNGAQYAQSPPVFWHAAIASSNPSGSVYQDITGLDAGGKYTFSTFFRPYALYPVPSDPNVDQFCTFTIAVGSNTVFTRQYTQANGTQSGYSYVQFNQLAIPDSSTRIQFSYSCPAGYIGNGIAHWFVDTTSLIQNTAGPNAVVCNPI